MLAGSGHIAGVVNPPSAHKYQYWTSDTLPERFDDFVAQRQGNQGQLVARLDRLAGAAIGQDGRQARVPGSGKYKAIEDAPGRYVKERI